MNAIADIVTYEDSLTVRNIFDTLTTSFTAWKPFSKNNSTAKLQLEDDKSKKVLQLEDDKSKKVLQLEDKSYYEDEEQSYSQLEDYSEVYNVKYNYFLYLVTVVETPDGPMLKGGRVPDNNFSDFETAKKIYDLIRYSDDTRIRSYLVRSPEDCDDEFLCSSAYSKNLDTGLPIQSSKFTVVLFRKSKKD